MEIITLKILFASLDVRRIGAWRIEIYTSLGMEISIHFVSFLSSDSPSVAGPCLTTLTLRSSSLQIGVKQGQKLLDANKSF